MIEKEIILQKLSLKSILENQDSLFIDSSFIGIFPLKFTDL